jgi:glycosyltransferase involved in cell wall biosynthesis
MKIDFCVPIHNEEKILSENTRKLLGYLKGQNFPFDWQIIIINNGSSDNSQILSEKLASDYPEDIRAVEYKKPGKGGALKKYFATSDADVLCYMDIDLAVALENIPSLLAPILENQADLVMGSRLLKNSQTDRGLWRSLSSQIYNLLSRLILGHPFSDLQCGFKAFKKEVYNQTTPYLLDNDWFLDTELITFGRYLNFRIREIPVNWQENRYDTRKSRVRLLSDSWKFIRNLLHLKKRLIATKKHPR